MLERLLLERPAAPSAAVPDGRTRQSPPGSGHRAGRDGAKRRKGGKARIAALAPGQWLGAGIAPANEQERAQAGEPCRQVREITGRTVAAGFVDQGDTGEETACAAAVHGVARQAVTKPAGETGFVRLPRRWLVERGFARLRRFRRLGRDYDRLSISLRQ